MHGYKCFYKGKTPIEVYTDKGSYDAQKRAAAEWKLKPSKVCDVTVVLCERPDGSTVEHSSGELG